ncbi:MAG: signal peptidase I, partial [Ignavibacteriaceae bacterium]|nr:signal peptidase I [Ignavibacteriaceae bacterium]
IPTSSMANTLLSGDYIIINKSAYAILLPTYIPFTGIILEPKNIISISQPQRGDVVVFQFMDVNKLLPTAGLYFVKRIIGLPGDTLVIKNKIVSINGEKIKLQGKAKVDTNNIKIKTDTTLYFKNKNWCADNMGPVVVPYKGMKIKLNHQNIFTWGMIINREYGKKVVSIEGTVITIKGKPVRDYILQKNYYFMMGDNRDNSIDSRYHGFVPENYITGKAEFIYWSYGNIIRWGRIFNTIR